MQDLDIHLPTVSVAGNGEVETHLGRDAEHIGVVREQQVGHTRREELARARQIPVVERHIEVKEMADFSECFLTGTAAEVTPVSEVGPYRFTPGEISKTLMHDYADDVRRPVSVVDLSAK